MKNEEEILSSQDILMKLMDEVHDLSMNPLDLIQSINQYYKPSNTIDVSESNSDVMGILATPYIPSKDSSDDFDLNDTLLDIVGEENELFSIEYNEDQSNVFELENIIDANLKEPNDFVYEKDVSKTILDDKNKKIGSVRQRTISVYDLYHDESNVQIILRFEDEAEDLFKLLKNKLMIYNNCIIDFNRVHVTETFLRSAFGPMMKYMTSEQLISKIELINIDEDYERLLYNDILVQTESLYYDEYQSNVISEFVDNLDENTKNYFNQDGTKITDSRIPFQKIYNANWNYIKEKKIRYPIYFVERVTKDLLENYKIDEIVFDYLSTIIDPFLDWNEIRENCSIDTIYSGYTTTKYKSQIQPEVFDLAFSFIQSLLIDKCYIMLEDLKLEIVNLKKEIDHLTKLLPKQFLNSHGRVFQTVSLDIDDREKLPDDIAYSIKRIEDLEFTLMDKEHKYFIKEDILKNIFETIKYSSYDNRLDKVKLITYHYIVKHLENISQDFYQTLDTKIIRSFINISEIFKFELLDILHHDKVLSNFIFTMKDLITKWVREYTKSLPGMTKTFYNINLTNEEVFSEYLLRYVALSAIKRKNPITLRAIFSSYISLIHTAIKYVFMHFNPRRKSHGCFSALQDDKELNEFNANRYFHTKNIPERKYAKILCEAIVNSNPKELHDNYFLFKKINFPALFEPNSLEMFSKKPENVSIHDWVFYWNYCYKHFDKSEVFKINRAFIKSDKRNSQLVYITTICTNILQQPIFEIVKDYDYVKDIIDIIAEDLSKRSINRGYLDQNFNLIIKDNSEYLNYIHYKLTEIAKTFNKG